jgi:hypothetical protein
MKGNKLIIKESILGQRIMLILFPFFTFFTLKLDSVSYSYTSENGQFYLTFIVLLYTFILWCFAGSQLKKMIIMMIFLSYIGELIFCKLLGWYTYRLNNIPRYVPLGHAIVFACGYIFSEIEILKIHDEKLNILFRILFSMTFLLLFFFGNDSFSLISGFLFLLLIRRKKWQSLYFYIAFCVVFIELVGTYYGAWKWKSELYGFIHTLNPPIGAVFFYAGGDVLLVKIINLIERKNIKVL